MPTLSDVQTVTTRSYDWVKKSRKPAPLAIGTPQWGAASGWSGPIAASSLPGSGDVQALNSYILGNEMYQGLWRGNQGWTRTVSIVSDVPDWNSGTWSGPTSISGLPGSGNMQGMANFVVANTLYQEFWRGNLGYRRSVPIVGYIQWGSATAWEALFTTDLPGLGDVQALNYYVIDNVITQGVWRGGYAYTRTIPVASGVPSFGSPGGWSTGSAISALPGSGAGQALNNYILNNIMYQGYWRGNQGYARTIPIASYQDAIAMYRSLPITVKVPEGYTIPNAANNCAYVRHLGSEFKPGAFTVPSVKVSLVTRTATMSEVWLELTDWPDGQPSIWIFVRRTYNANGTTQVDIFYNGNSTYDTRDYPIQVYWGPIQILNDHRIWSKWLYHGTVGAAVGGRGNKYFQRTEDIVALKLLESEPDHSKLNSWCSANWPDTDADIHSPLFEKAMGKANDYIYQTGSPMYLDCTKNHQGCPSDWAADSYRFPATSWGFSHRSKVCIWQGGYTWVLAQDPFGLMSQAIHKLVTTNNPWATITDSWPSGVPGKPSSMTVIGIAEWVRDTYYRPGVGVTMYQVPVIGNDQRASSLRTNQFLILTTLLAYRYLIGGWATYADTLADILINVSIGGPGQPAYGCKTTELGNITRPDYFGAQLYIWDDLSGSGGSGLGLKDFGWLRQTINEYLNLPHDDEDFILSTIETTATYCQALRTYGWHKYGWLYGPSGTIPGY